MELPRRVTQTVILAAGSGSRLAATPDDLPKPLTVVGGVPLIAHALEHARASGCDEAVIVIGYKGARVQAAIEAMRPPLRIRFLESQDHTAPNGVSLLAAEQAAAHAIFLQMVDHVFARPALAQLVATPLMEEDAGRVLVDSAPSSGIDLNDATKVRFSNGRVTAIGKGLTSWDAIDAGCFVLTHAVFEALRRVPADQARTVSSGMRRLVAQGRLGWVDVGGVLWADVDTPSDRESAERLLTQHPHAAERGKG
jgi:1L-myo-inositol 1-phosphate cytidylyltransferase